MSRLGEILAQCLQFRSDLPPDLVGRFDVLTETASRHAACLDAREARDEMPDDIHDFRPLAEVVELHGPRGVA